MNITVAWFPRQMKDLDRCNMLITKFDPNMDQDHPVSVYIICHKVFVMFMDRIQLIYSPFIFSLQGYSDPDYRKRRAAIAELAFRYKQ